MNAENSTGNGGPLSLAERAKRGLLAVEQSLFVHEIAWLEHPADQAARARLADELLAAIHCGDLPDDDYVINPIGYQVRGL